MIKKILFSLLLCLTLTLTFVSTKVSADVPSGYTLNPIVEDETYLSGTTLFYDIAPTNVYVFHVGGTGIATGTTFAYNLNVNSSGVWHLVILDASTDEFQAELLFEGETFTLSNEIDGAPPVSSNFVCWLISGDNQGSIGTIDENPDTPGDNESNTIYNGVFELLADTLYGGTDNLTDTQVGVIEWFSILITLTCLLLPFIIVFFVIKLLFK